MRLGIQGALWSGLAVLLWPVHTTAQTPDGQIVGRIRDQVQASVPAAKVSAVNAATGVRTATRTTTEGNYRLRSLIPGIYRLEAEADGFKRLTQWPIEVRVGDVLTIDLALELGAVTESVTVTAEAPLLEAASASLGKVVDNRRIMDLPVPGGSVFYLMQMTPGVASTGSPTNLYNANEMGPPNSVVTSGSRASATEFTIDGNPIMSNAGVTFNPPQEMVQEFRVQTAAYDASLGRFTGAHVNLVMKSGTNEVHGSAVYSNLSRGMMSHDYFTNRFIWDPRTGPITSDKIDRAWPPQRIIQYRGVIGGPVYLPKLYDGRNRTFWMFGGHALDRAGSTRAFYTVPTARQRDGDFSELLALGGRYQIYDPATIVPAANGRFSRQPLAGNLVPASRIHPMSKRLIQYYPLPNTVGTADGVNNYTDPDANGNDYNSYMGRADHVVSEKNRLSGSVTILEQRDYSLQSFHNEAKGNRLYRIQRGLAMNDTWTLRPSLLIDFRYGFTRYGQHNYPPSLGFDLSSLGLPAAVVSQLDRAYTTVPETTISGYTTIGNNSGTNVITNYHIATAQATSIRGRHTWRAGTEFRVMQENRYAWGNVSPAFSFTTGWTQGPLDNSPAAPIGQGLAAFLLGTPNGGGIDRNATAAEQSKYWAFFLQDDYKLSTRLTITLGVRYELDLPLTERYNRSLRDFDFTAAPPFAAAARAAYAASPVAEVPAAQFQPVGSLLYAGVNGAPRALWNGDKNNFSPRIGLAWRWREQTVVRAGYGIFYEPGGSDRSTVSQLGYSRRTPLVPSLDNGQTFRATLQNPFPDGILEPEGAAMGYRAGLGTSVSYFAPNLRSGYSQRWSLGVQREMGRRLLLELNYVGNRAVGLALGQQYNPVPAQYLSTAQVRDQRTIDFLSQAVPNPFFGLPGWEGAGLQGRTTTRAQLLRAFPHFTGVSASDNGGYSWYHSMQFRAEKRFAQGYTVDASYSYSKLMEAVGKLNETDLRPHRVISSLDRTHVLALSGLYELPFGKRKRWLSSGYLTNLVAGGWQLQAIYQAQNGPPIDFGNIFFYGDIKNIPLSSAQKSVERWFNVDAGFERDNLKQPGSNIRTFPLRFNGIRADGFNNWNISAIKSFPLREKTELQFRAEAVDAMNIPTFAAPNTGPNSTAFGQVTGMRNNGTQRRITFVGRLSW